MFFKDLGVQFVRNIVSFLLLSKPSLIPTKLLPHFFCTTDDMITDVLKVITETDDTVISGKHPFLHEAMSVQ